MPAPVQIATAQELFGRPAGRRYQVVGPLPVLGVSVRIRSLTERELSAYQSATLLANGQGLKRAKLEDASRRLIALCVVDEQGNPVIGDAEFCQMQEWDAADATYLYAACAAHVGIKTEDVEDLVKNSERIPAGGSR